jgi:hypothetical protein
MNAALELLECCQERGFENAPSVFLGEGDSDYHSKAGQGTGVQVVFL